MGFVKALWRGEKSLVFTFWVMGLGGASWLLSSLYYTLFLTMVRNSQTTLYATAIVTFLYVFFIFVSIWKSSAGCIDAKGRPRVWGILARLFYSGMVISYLVVLFWLLKIIQVANSINNYS